MQKFKEFWKVVYSLAGEKNIFYNASALTFNIFICAVPFTLIIISIIGYVLTFDEAFAEIIRYGGELLPNFSYESESNDIVQGSETLENILRPLIGARQVIGVLGFLILLLFTQGLLHTAKLVLFDVFDIEERRHPMAEILYKFFGFGLIGAVFLFFSLAISFISVFSFQDIEVPFTEYVIRLAWIYTFLNNILPIIFTFFIQYVVFRYVSERRITVLIAIVGATTNTVLLLVAKFLVSNYLQYAFESYRFYYQGYAILVILSLWIFYSALLFVVAAIFARAFNEVFGSHKASSMVNPYADLD